MHVSLKRRPGPWPRQALSNVAAAVVQRSSEVRRKVPRVGVCIPASVRVNRCEGTPRIHPWAYGAVARRPKKSKPLLIITKAATVVQYRPLTDAVTRT